MAKRASALYARKHKKMIFHPGPKGDKRFLKHLLVQKTDITFDDGSRTTGRLADHFYFRIYKHKGQPYTLYMGPQKVSHGGLRVKPSGKKRTKPKTPGQPDKPSKPVLHESNDVEKFLSHYHEIESGPHSGKFRNIDSGDILTASQLRIALASRGKT